MINQTQIRQVETNANIILTIIRENPKIKTKDILRLAREHDTFSAISESAFRRYLQVLNYRGYTQKIGIYEHGYKAVSNEAFAYTNGYRNCLKSTKRIPEAAASGA